MRKLLLSVLFISSSLLVSNNSNANYSYMYDADNFDQTLSKYLKDTISYEFNNGTGLVETEFSSSSGTSAYIKYSYNDGDFKSNGAILAKSEANDVLGEIVAYKLALLLGVEEIFSAKTLIKVEGSGLNIYKSEMLKLKKILRGKRGYKIKKENISNVLKFIKEEKVLYTAFAPWGHKPYIWDALINPKHPLRKAITVRGKQAVDLKEEKIISFKGSSIKSGVINKSRLAKELSNHMVIDMITGQYDRFSGGNLQYFLDDNGEVHIGAYDNGGTFEWSDTRFARYSKVVSRFDPILINNLRNLSDFLAGKTENFKDFSKISEIKEFLELENPRTNQLKNGNSIYLKLDFYLNKTILFVEKTCSENGIKHCYIR